jgi:hypothetical protein
VGPGQQAKPTPTYWGLLKRPDKYEESNTTVL